MIKINKNLFNKKRLPIIFGIVLVLLFILTFIISIGADVELVSERKIFQPGENLEFEFEYKSTTKSDKHNKQVLSSKNGGSDRSENDCRLFILVHYIGP